MKGDVFLNFENRVDHAIWDCLVITPRESQTSQQTSVALAETFKAKPTFDIAGVLCHVRLQKHTSVHPLQAAERGKCAWMSAGRLWRHQRVLGWSLSHVSVLKEFDFIFNERALHKTAEPQHHLHPDNSLRR